MIAAKQEKAALAAAENLQQEKPEDPEAAFLTGKAALAAKNKKKAEGSFLRALELAPQWDQPLATIIQLYVGDRRIDDALKLCTRLAAQVPDAPAPGFFLGVMQERKGDSAAAEKTYRALLGKHPDMAPAAGNLAFLLSMGKSTPERLAEAEKLAETAAGAGSTAALDTLGWIQHRLGKNAEAEGNLRRAYAAYKNSPVVTYHLAAALAALGASTAKTQEGKAKLAEAGKLLEPLVARPGVPYQSEAKQLLGRIKALK
jgi:predicted Zn-dependent protease